VQGAKQSPKAKVKDKRVILCHPQALKMPLCKECKKLTISSSSPSSPFHTFDSPFPPCKFPPTSLPMGGHDNAKRAQKECNCFAKLLRLEEGECRILIRHFFSQSRQLLTKIFESEATVNEKFECEM
jgi:hypothetical protein